MNKVVSVGLLMAISFSAYSAPWVVSDPTLQGVTHCVYSKLMQTITELGKL